MRRLCKKLHRQSKRNTQQSRLSFKTAYFYITDVYKGRIEAEKSFTQICRLSIYV